MSSSAQPTPKRTIIIYASGEKVGCGGFEKRGRYTVTGPIDPPQLEAETKRVRQELKEAKGWPWIEFVRSGQSYAVAEVKKRVNECEWTNIMWAVSNGDNASEALAAKVKREPGQQGFTIVESKYLGLIRFRGQC